MGGGNYNMNHYATSPACDLGLGHPCWGDRGPFVTAMLICSFVIVGWRVVGGFDGVGGSMV